MDFNSLDFLKIKERKKLLKNPVSPHGEEGIDIEFLNEKFGQYSTATEMKDVTDSEGLKLFFDYLVEQGKLPQ